MIKKTLSSTAFVLAVAALVTTACGGDDDGGSEGNAGTGTGGSASAGASATGGSGQSSGTALLAACTAYCQHYAQVCSAPDACDQYCRLVQTSVPSACATPYQQFFDCGAKATLECARGLGTTPTSGCGQEQILTCLGADGCNRFASIDNLCNDAHPGLIGFICTGEDEPGCVALDATDTASRSRCCPPP